MIILLNGDFNISECVGVIALVFAGEVVTVFSLLTNRGPDS